MNPGFLNSKAQILKLVCTFAILAMVLISFIVYKASLQSMLTFALFFIVYVLIPGILIFDVSGISLRYTSEKLLISSFTGWALVVAEYFIAMLIKTNTILYCLGPMLSIVFFYRLKTSKQPPVHLSKIRPPRISLALYLATLLMMAYVFLNTQYVYLNPEYSQDVSMSIDKAYQGGLISALARDFVPNSPWVFGVKEHYHFFTQILLSVPFTLFGLAPDFLIMSASPYLSVYFILLSFYAMFRHFCKYKERAGLYTLSVLLSNMFIARTPTTSYLFRILFVNDNHGGFAISCLMACLIITDVFFKSEGRTARKKLPILIYVLVLFMMLTGIKAPLGLVMVGSVIGTWILGLILKEITLKESIAFIMLTSLGFYVVFSILIGSSHASGTDSGSIVKFGKMTNICFWKDDLIDGLRSIGVPGQIRLLIILLVFALSYFTIYSIPFAIGYIREFCLVVSRKKKFSFALVSAYAAAFIGFVLMMFTSYSGHSQVYFGTVATVFAPFISFLFIEDLPNMSSGLMRRLRSLSLVWFFITICITSATLILDINSMIPGALVHTNPASKYNPYNSLSAGEYEATKWLKENTPQDSVTATQMYASMNKNSADYDYKERWLNCHFMYATYSCRQFYLEGSGFTLEDNDVDVRYDMIEKTEQLYDVSNKSRGEEARALGIDYVLVTKKVYPTPDLSSDEYELVFTNNDVDIYRISDS